MTTLTKLAIAHGRQSCAIAKPSKNICEDTFDSTYKNVYSKCLGNSGKVFMKLMRRKYV